LQCEGASEADEPLPTNPNTESTNMKLLSPNHLANLRSSASLATLLFLLGGTAFQQSVRAEEKTHTSESSESIELQKNTILKIDPIICNLIQRIAYDADERVLDIRIRHRGTYSFEAIPPMLFNEFMEAKNKGYFFNTWIAPEFTAELIPIPSKEVETRTRNIHPKADNTRLAVVAK